MLLSGRQTNSLVMIRLWLSLIILAPLVFAHAQQTQTSQAPSRTGWLAVQLPELPGPPVKPAWIPYGFQPSAERFEIYIPPGYKPETPHGILGWTNPVDDAGTPRRFEPLLNEYRLIAISAERCGNNQPMSRRIGLLVSATLQLSRSLSIDKSRLILSGFSGGGRTSAAGCLVHPEMWRGAISWAGGNYYKSYPVPLPVGASAPGLNDYHPNAVTPQNVKDAKTNARFVLISGPKDFNLNDSRGIYRAMKKEGFQALLIEEPGMGHEVGSVESMRKALDFVLAP